MLKPMQTEADTDAVAVRTDLVVPQLRFTGWVGFLFAAVASVRALGMNVLAGAFDVYGFIAIVALPLVYWLGRNAIKNPPTLRASHQGLRFLDGRLIPWHTVKQIKVARPNVLKDGLLASGSILVIYFKETRTILQLPLVYWFNSIFSNGDVDVAIRGTKKAAAVKVAQLDALYAHSLGSGAAALPTARVHQAD